MEFIVVYKFGNKKVNLDKIANIRLWLTLLKKNDEKVSYYYNFPNIIISCLTIFILTPSQNFERKKCSNNQNQKPNRNSTKIIVWY